MTSILMLDGDTEQWVFKFLADHTRIKPKAISLHSRLLHDLGITGDDAYELLRDFSEAFGLDMKEFEFLDHFPDEAHCSMFSSKDFSEFTPVTVQELVSAAKARKWLHGDLRFGHDVSESGEVN